MISRLERPAGIGHRPIQTGGVVGSRRRIAARDAVKRARRDVHESDPVRRQPLVRFCGVVGERAHDFTVVVAKIRKAVRLDHRPIGEIPEQ